MTQHDNDEPVRLDTRMSADRELESRERDHLNAGWRRVRDAVREAELPAEAIDPVLDAVLRADPDDGDASAVYADWMLARGSGARRADRGAARARGSAGRSRTLAAGGGELSCLEDHADELARPALAAHVSR